MLNKQEVKKLYKEIKRRLKFEYKGVRIVPIGSFRRNVDNKFKDLDLLIVANYHRNSSKILSSAKLTGTGKWNFGKDYISGQNRREIKLISSNCTFILDLFLTNVECLPFALFHYTGPKEYNIRTRMFAKRKGWKLNQYGVFMANSGRRVPLSGMIKNEKDLTKFIGLKYRKPNNR